MPHEDAPIRMIARRSLRVHSLLLGVIALCTLQFGLLISSGLLHLQEHQKRLESDFQRVHAALSEQEHFVRRWRLHQPTRHPVSTSHDSLTDMSRWITTSAAPTSETDPPDALAQDFSSFHGGYWAQTPFPGPQCMLTNAKGDAGLVGPIDPGHPTETLSGSVYPPLLLEQIHHIKASVADFSTGQVIWQKLADTGPDNPLLSVTQSPSTDTSDTGAIGCLLLPSRLQAPSASLSRDSYSQFSLISPDGRTMLGAGTKAPGEAPSSATRPRITRDGLVYQFRTQDGWLGMYELHWPLLLRQPRGPLLTSVLAALLLALGGAILIHFYRHSVLDPLRNQHLRLLESEAFSRTILQSAPVGVCLLRSSDGKVMLDNPQVRTWLGDDHDKAGWTGAWRIALRQPLQACSVQELEYISPNDRHLRITATPTRYKGHPILLCIFIDVTSQVEAERTLLAAREASEEASQAKSRFLATVSHEIRTPLHGILGTVELLSLTLLNDRQSQHVSAIKTSSSMLMQLINDILDLSKAEAGQLSVQMQPCCPARLTEDTAQAWTAAAARKNLLLYASIQPDLPAQIRSDPQRIRQVLDNLLSNAIKFTDHGQVVLRVTCTPDDDHPGTHRIHWQIADSGIGIDKHNQSRLFDAFYQVSPGISHVQGTGLGLSISAHLARKLGGTIQLTSERGLGSSFILSLPSPPCTIASASLKPITSIPTFVAGSPRELASNLVARLQFAGIAAHVFGDPPSREATPDALLVLLPCEEEPPDWNGPILHIRSQGDDRPRFKNGAWEVGIHHLDAILHAISCTAHPPEPLQAPSLTAPEIRQLPGWDILVAEDNPINQAILAEQLERMGCRATLVPDGLRALSAFETGQHDLILTDINMPAMDGHELTRQIRKRGSVVPIIGITASTASEERERGLSSGMNAMLTKPFSIDALQRAIEEVMATADQEVILQIPDNQEALFMEVMSADLQSLEHSLARQDAESISRMIHRLAGAIGLSGDRCTAEHCQTIEIQLDQGVPPAQLAPQITNVIARIRAALTKVKQQLDGGLRP